MMDSCVYSADVQIDFPIEWGDFHKIVDAVNGKALHYLIWNNFQKWIKTTNQHPIEGVGYMTDICNGFDTDCVRVSIQIDDDFDLLTSTVDAMKIALHRSYMSISHRRRKLAKDSADCKALNQAMSKKMRYQIDPETGKLVVEHLT